MTTQANEHHLVMGELIDFLTGEVRPDTHDERYRQKIAKYLIETKKYHPKEVIANQKLKVNAGNRKAIIKVDFLITMNGKTFMLVKYAPGSLVTRRISTLALSRIIYPYQIPFVVVTNGEDGELIDGLNGSVMDSGFGRFPGKDDIKKLNSTGLFPTIEPKVFDQASRIAFACEIDGACPCDSDILY